MSPWSVTTCPKVRRQPSAAAPITVDAEHYADAAAEFTVYRLSCEVCSRSFSGEDYMRLAVELNRHLYECRTRIVP